MIINNKIIFFIIFCILQLAFILLYQKQDKMYFLEYEAYVKDSKLKKIRSYNDALNKVYVEIHKKIKFKNTNTEVLGNITKKKMQDWDWDKNWFQENIRLYFAINSPNKNMNNNLEKDLKSDLSVTLQIIKSELKKKIEKINSIKAIIISQELDQIDQVYENYDYLFEIDNDKKQLDKLYNELFLNFKEKIELLQKQHSDKKKLLKNKTANKLDIDKTMAVIWDENLDMLQEDQLNKLENQINSIKKFNIWSKLTTTKEIQFLQLQISLIDNIDVKQSEIGKKYKPIHLYLFSAFFLQFFLYTAFDVSRKLIEKFKS
jgi:hypothetical protein